ncbi:MAG: cobalamin-binding protein, partial [Pseudomonadota bacterium]
MATRARPRVVSLLPSATEMVALVGCADLLVGISHECDWPASVRGRPILIGSRLVDAGSSGQIDRDVRALVGDALSIYRVDAEALA